MPATDVGWIYFSYPIIISGPLVEIVTTQPVMPQCARTESLVVNQRKITPHLHYIRYLATSAMISAVIGPKIGASEQLLYLWTRSRESRVSSSPVADWEAEEISCPLTEVPCGYLNTFQRERPLFCPAGPINFTISFSYTLYRDDGLLTYILVPQ